MAKKRGNNEGSIFQHSNGKWVAKLTCTDPLTGKEKAIWKYADGRPEADAKLTELKYKRMTGDLTIPSKITVKDWIEYWLKDCMAISLKPSPYAQYESMARVHIIPVIGKKKLQALQTSDLQQLYSSKLRNGRVDGKGGLSPRTIRHIHNVVHGALEQAFKEGKVAKNVSDLVKLPKKTKPEISILSLEQVQEFLDAAKSDRLYAAFLLELNTGLRRGEVLGLRWKDIDFNRGKFTVRQTVQRVKVPNGDRKTQIIFGTPKTNRSKRSLPLPPEVIKELKAHKARINQERLAAGKAYENKDLVFCNELGQPLDPRAFTKKYERMLETAGLEKVTFHSLRHTVAILAIKNGVPVKTVQDLLGHEDFSTTMNLYGDHVDSEMLEQAVMTLNSLINKKISSQEEK